jgi:predicted PhzF superfamily epimerase YddE/YHI9
MAATASKLLEKVTARVFCSQNGGGGNPLTIFSAPGPVKRASSARLARTCEWESVVVDTRNRRLSFFMPNGDPVRFCAHAAMGGAMVLGSRVNSGSGNVTFSVNPGDDLAESDREERQHLAVVHPEDIVSLEVQDQFSFSKVSHPPALQRILRDCFGLSGSDLMEPLHPARPKHPTFGNATVFGRPKTLVFVNSLDKLQTVRVPPPGPSFISACDAVASTGIYLYSHSEEDGHYECRQFPRSSGYPEDPATGVAAAALACSLHSTGIRSSDDDSAGVYRFVQGTAMLRPSLLLVEDIEIGKGDDSVTEPNTGQSVRFRLMGSVQVDKRETVAADDL